MTSLDSSAPTRSSRSPGHAAKRWRGYSRYPSTGSPPRTLTSSTCPTIASAGSSGRSQSCEPRSLRCQPTACGGRESNKSRPVRIIQRNVRKLLAEQLGDLVEQRLAGGLAALALKGGKQRRLVLHRRSSWTCGPSIPWRLCQTPRAGSPRRRDEHRTLIRGRHRGTPTSTHPAPFSPDQTLDWSSKG
jgi:hypothetical protein